MMSVPSLRPKRPAELAAANKPKKCMRIKAVIVHLELEDLAFSLAEISSTPRQSTCLMDHRELAFFFIPEVQHHLPFA